MNNIQVKNVINRSKNIAPLLENHTIEFALQSMKANEISSVVIVDDENKPIGIFTEQDALHMIGDHIPKVTQLSNVMTKNPFTIDEECYLHDAYTQLNAKGYRHLIIVDKNKKYLGVISEGDFIRHLGFEESDNGKHIKEIMNQFPLIVNKQLTIVEVAKHMSKKQSDYAIVTENNKPIGILSERAITHYFTENDPDDSLIVATLMSSDVHFTTKDISIKDAAAIIEEHNVHQLIIIDEEQNILGILNRHDVLKAIHGYYFEFLIKTIEHKTNVVQSLTENKEALYQETLLLENIINTIPDLVWVKDLNGIYITCNDTFERFFGQPLAAIKGKSDFDFVDAELAQFFRDHDKKAIEANKAVMNEEHLKFVDGSYEGEFETIKSPLKDKEGRVIGVVGIARDITERKNTTEALRKKDADFRYARAFANLGLWSFSIPTNSFSASEETKKIYGLNENESFSFEEIQKTIHPEDEQKVLDAFEASMKTGEHKSIHRIIVHENVKWVYSSGKAIYDDYGQIIGMEGVLQDITKLKQFEDQLENFLKYDTLTGLANRNQLNTYLQKSVEQALKHKKTMALILFDLDRFKDINDSYGHQIGDELLVLVARRLEQQCNEKHFISRLGGDEFAIVLDDIESEETAAIIANNTIELISKKFELSNKLLVHIGLSAGIVIVPNHTQDAQEVLQYADTALYKAKQEGKNTFRYYTDELTQSARNRIEYEDRLRKALKNKEFELYYQPQIHIESGKLVGAEALIRWNDKKNGIIKPTDFIPIAEELGLITQIGQWVIEEACKQGKAWHDKGYDLHLSVNVSAQQLDDPNLSLVIDNALSTTGFTPNNLTLELTESIMMRHEEELSKILYTFREKGIQLALDDFGTGYSSYSYLKRFPINILKIDKSFIDDIPNESDDVAIVKAIIAMGSALGFQVLAEGVENKEQSDFLLQEKCAYFQGYFKSVPLPANEFEKLF